MKTTSRISVLPYLLLFVVLVACSSNDDDGRTPIINDLVAAISPDCNPNINFEDDQGNVYAYRADNIFGVVSIQTGGHSTPNETTDLGVNIYGADPIFGLPSTSSYTVTDGSRDPGTAYVFYIDNGTEYISTANNVGKSIRLDGLTLSPDGTVTEILVSFSEIEMANNNDPTELLCVTAFNLSYTMN